ncbi:MAG: ABC transporter permease [Deltaproteobacteria bacterium]|nr:ABC transporter permease [Deltaproteobacteria bacterium]
MRNMLVGTAVVAAATLLEAVRNRILMIGLLFAVVLLGLSVAAASVSFGEESRLIIDVGLAASSVFGAAIAISLSIASFAGELRRHTAYPILARPIPRFAFVLGKYLGVVVTVVIVVAVMVAATATIVTVYDAAPPSAFWASLVLTAVEVQLVVAVATLFSALTSPALAAAFSVGLVLAGNLAGDIQLFALRLSNKGVALGYWLQGLYYLLPDLQRLSARTQAANHLEVAANELVLNAAYGLGYGVAALVLACWLFDRRRVI